MHTKFEGVTDTKRAFFIGDNLVVRDIENIGKELSKRIQNG
jgi:DNA (cytosine-5)-methyltransferase 1